MSGWRFWLCGECGKVGIHVTDYSVAEPRLRMSAQDSQTISKTSLKVYFSHSSLVSPARAFRFTRQSKAHESRVEEVGLVWHTFKFDIAGINITRRYIICTVHISIIQKLKLGQKSRLKLNTSSKSRDYEINQRRRKGKNVTRTKNYRRCLSQKRSPLESFASLDVRARFEAWPPRTWQQKSSTRKGCRNSYA